MDFWEVVVSYMLPLTSILVGLIAIFITIRVSRQTDKTLEEIKKGLDRRVAKSIKSLEDANLFIREHSSKIQDDLISLIKESRLPNDQLTSHTKSDVDFVLSKLEDIDKQVLGALSLYPADSPKFTTSKEGTTKPKAGKKFKEYLSKYSPDEVDDSISKLCGFELIEYALNPKSPTQSILKQTEKGAKIYSRISEQNSNPTP
ncbi:MAG TPA: hypothetical protein PKV16_04915 [Caldisericia bacterium]|nr:hypothetical protein [Caldisericia bacterium]HPF48653.1 hypothetical protein [Caldisericia bacterium]HPI83687.1 hypothetical protein [Caldisericia bacterium]HPQ93108.1 hypothetical protein [Caldisericia bacterium]HRV75059.1 hypothetical protein [Caldisericia bacterium]